MADPVDSIDSALVRAGRLTAQGQPHAAVAVLRPALELYPESSVAWCRLAAAYLEAGEPGESLTAAKRAIVFGERSWGHRLASLALVELGRHEEAVVSAREAVRRDAADWRCHVTLAEALAHDAPVDAVRVARAAVALAPLEARAHEVLGDAAVHARDWSAAEDAYREALRLEPAGAEEAAVAAKLDRLVRRPRDGPERRRAGRPRVVPRFGRVDRVALLLAVRRAAMWQAVGTLVLLVAGSSGLLVWFGLGLVVFVVMLAWRGWLGLPATARVSPREVAAREPLVAAAAVLLAVSVVGVLGWTVVLALGPGLTVVLAVALCCAAAATVCGSLGLRRVWSARR